MKQEQVILEKEHIMTEDSILSFLHAEKNKGASDTLLRQRRHFVTVLYQWLPEGKVLTTPVLLAWRQSLQEKGYSEDTICNYVKGVNRYLDHVNCSEMRFSRGRAKDLTGQVFGYLTALEPSGTHERRSLLWHCRCKCGNELEVSATRLLDGSVMSCGCLHTEHLQRANMNIAGTSLRQSLDDSIFSTRNQSGFIGVTKKRGKWRAQINYKGTSYYLGSYSKLEDAVKARSRAKERVLEDAQALLSFYTDIHKNDPQPPDRKHLSSEAKQRNSKPKPLAAKKTSLLRTDNTSGCVGVTRHRDRWVAKITYQKKTYHLGAFIDKKPAILARKNAETLLRQNPDAFLKAYERTSSKD